MSTLPSTRQRALHEAFHAAGLLMLGLPPEAARIDFPGGFERGDKAGLVTVDFEPGDVDAMRRLLVATLLGPIQDGEGWKDFPPDPERVVPSARSDATNAAILLKLLDFDRVGWAEAVWRAGQLTQQREFRHLVVAIADAFDTCEVLDSDDLARIHDSVREALTCST